MNPKLRPPYRISAFSLPENEREHARALEGNLFKLGDFQHQFKRDLELVEFCFSQANAIKEKISFLGDRPDEFFMFLDWRETAARDGAMVIWDFATSMHLARDNLNKCYVLKSMVSGSDIERSIKKFHKYFPSAENIRHHVAHSAGVSGTRNYRKKNGSKGAYDKHGILMDDSSKGNLISGMKGNVFIVTIYGEIIEYELSRETLEKLDEIRIEFQACFEGAAEATTDLLCRLGTARAMANPLKPLGA
jgi:hypothetical protein